VTSGSWRLLKRRLAYSNPWLRVYEDRVERPDGMRGRYGVVEVGDAVSVVAWERGCFWLVRQYRHSWGKRVWEVPCGGLARGEAPLSAAKRELWEETGLRAKRWLRLGVIEANDPVVNRFHLFLATELVQDRPQRDDSEADMICRRWSLAEFEEAVRRGTIRDDMTIACVAKALLDMKHFAPRVESDK